MTVFPLGPTPVAALVDGQALHEARQDEDPDHDDISCWCCCWDCDDACDSDAG